MLILGLFAGTSEAEQICEISQITNTTEGSSNNPVINSEGTYLVFSSSSNLLGFGDVDDKYDFELYLYDIASKTIDQITRSADGRVFDKSAINPDGSVIAFAYTGDLLGDSPEGEPEIGIYADIYLYYRQTAEITRLTQIISPGIYGNYTPSLNFDGTTIAFGSDDNITGENPDGNVEVLMYDEMTDIFTQVTHGTCTGSGGSVTPSITLDAKFIAFISSCDITGENPDGNTELFLYDVANNFFSQISDTRQPNNVYPFALNEDATLFAYAAGASGIYIYDSNKMVISQITEERSDSISMTLDGEYISFASIDDITGENPDGNEEIFLFDRKETEFTQITNTIDGLNGSTSISSKGKRIAFRSSGNIEGGNPDGNVEIYLAECRKIATEGGGGCTLAHNPVSSSLAVFIAVPVLLLIRRIVKRFRS